MRPRVQGIRCTALRARGGGGPARAGARGVRVVRGRASRSSDAAPRGSCARLLHGQRKKCTERIWLRWGPRPCPSAARTLRLGPVLRSRVQARALRRRCGRPTQSGHDDDARLAAAFRAADEGDGSAYAEDWIGEQGGKVPTTAIDITLNISAAESPLNLDLVMAEAASWEIPGLGVRQEGFASAGFRGSV